MRDEDDMASQAVEVVETRAGRLCAAAVSAADLCALDIPKPRSLLGDGVLTSGGLGILYGKPGGGKTWQTLELSRAWVRGETWLGLRTPPEGVRVGVLELELGLCSMQQRLKALGVGTHERDSALRIVCRPNLRGTVDLCQPVQVADLRAWVESDELDVLMVDALSRAHSASENKAEELAPVLAALDALRHETGCAVLAVHHERKQGNGSGDDNDLDALRGSSRLQSDPTLLLRLKRSTGDLRCLTFVKVSEGHTPEPVWFRLGQDGRPEVVQPPRAKGDGNRERVLRAVLDAPQPVSRGEIADALTLDPATVTRHLRVLVEAGSVACSGENKATRYHAPTSAPAQPAQHGACAGVATFILNGLSDFSRSTGAEVATETEGHRRTGATGAPKGAHGRAPVTPVPPPHGQAVESSTVGGSDA